MEDLPKAIAHRYGKYLATNDLHIVESTQDPDNFGNEIVVIEGPDLRVRVIKDRSELSIQIALYSTRDDWWELHQVIQLLGSTGSGTSPTSGTDTLSELMNLFQAHYPSIIRLVRTKSASEIEADILEVQRYQVMKYS